MKVDFKAKQSEFAAYIRDPINNPRPTDVKKQRIETYRELFFNNVDSFLSSNFPVLRTLLNDEQWFELAQDFFSKHASSSPYFSEIPEEFISYLQEQRNNANDYPFLLELAHYEWVEMALATSKEEATVNTEAFINTIEQHNISLSVLAWPLVYRYPVEQISVDFIPETAPEQATYLLVYRNLTDEVNFLKITPLTYRLLQIIQQSESVSCQSCLQQISQELNHPEPHKIISGGLQTLKDLAQKNIICQL